MRMPYLISPSVTIARPASQSRDINVGSVAQQVTVVTRLNQELVVAMTRGDDQTIGRLLQQLSAVTVTVELIRATGVLQR